MLETVKSLTGGGGRHIFFAYPGLHVASTHGRLGPGLDIKADGGYVVGPPSVHLSGRRYEWEVSGHPNDVAVAELPGWLLDQITRQPEPSAPLRLSAEPIREGGRNATLTSIAGSMRRKGLLEDSITEALLVENSARCLPPLTEREVHAIAHSVCRYAPNADQLEPSTVTDIG